MASLRLPVASEICDQRKSNTCRNFGYNEVDVISCGAWRSKVKSCCVLRGKKLMDQNPVRFFDSFVGIGERKLSHVSLLTGLSPAAIHQESTSSVRFKNIRVYVLDSSSGVLSAVEGGCRPLMEPASDKGSSVNDNRHADLKKSETSNVKRNKTRKIAKKSLASDRLDKGMSLEPIFKKGNRSKYVRKDYATGTGLDLIGTEVSVGYCNSILKDLEQTSEEKALSFFEWMRRHGKLKGNSTAYNLAIRVLSRKEDWNAVEMLLQEMDSDSDCELNPQVFNSVIFVCAKRGILGKGTRWFHLMLEKGVQPNFATFGMLMGLYRKAGNLSRAKYAFDKMRHFKVQCVAAYSAMITIYTRQGLYNKSEEVIHLMKEDEVAPNLENWLVQLNTYCQQGKLKEAESIFKSIQKSRLSNDSMNLVAYNTLITGYGKLGNTKAAKHVFQSLQTVGLEPDETTYRSMVECCGRTGNYVEAKWYYKELKHSGFHPNSSNFYTMINLQARHEDETGAIQTLLDMKSMGCQLPAILSSLIQAYERVGRMERVLPISRSSFYNDILLDASLCSILALAFVRNSLLDNALQILQEKRWIDSIFEDNLFHTLICSCKEAGRYEDAVIIFNQMPKSEANPNLHIACSMIDVYSCMNRFKDAEALYLNLQSSGIRLDMITYSVVVRMYVKSGSLKDACVVLDLVEKRKDIEPDTYLYRDMLRVYQQCNMHEKLGAAYYKMLKRDLWDEAMYNCVINCCGPALPVDEISRLFDEMIQRGYAASTITLNVMLDIYGKAGLITKAEKLFQMARKLGLADLISYNTLIAAYGRKKNFESMQDVIQQMQYSGFSISLEAYNCLLDAYGKKDRLEEFNQVLQDMNEARCASDHYTYNIMINIYGKKGWIEDVSYVLAELRERGLEPDLYSYNSLIKAYGIAGMPEEAVGVVKEMREKGIQPDKITFINVITALQRNENYLEAVKWSLWLKEMEQTV